MMPDPEVGQILTQLYHSAPPPMAPNPSSQLPLPNPHGYAYQAPTPGSEPGRYSSPQAPSPAPSNPAVPPKRTRFRPTKSCERCREKKLKCDREVPCGACLKGNRDGSQCVYRDGADGEHLRSVKRMRVDPQPPRTEAQLPPMSIPYYGPNAGETRMVEPPNGARGSDWSRAPVSLPIVSAGYDGHQKTSVLAAGTPVRFTAPTTKQENKSASLLGRIQLKNSKSRYLSVADRLGLLERFEDTKSFIMNSFKDPDAKEIMHELSTYHQVFNPDQRRLPEISITREELPMKLRNALPNEAEFNKIQSKYCSNWETNFRVLHIPTFVKDCNSIFSMTPEESTRNLKQHVLPQALAVMCISARLGDSETTANHISEEHISCSLELVQIWLNSLHGKALLDLHSLQVRALLLIARQASLTRPLELWKDSGLLVRVAMAMGLHQDPECCAEMTLFTKEMRRKLWMTITELDLNFALLSGMPAAITSSNLNIGEILNVDDEELDHQMERYPPSKSLETWTTALPQITLGQSLRIRLDLTDLLGGNVNMERDTPVLLQHANVLERELYSLPPIFRSSTTASSDNDKRIDRLFISIMLQMSILRPLLALYRTIALSPVSSRYPEARKGALRTALAMLSYLDALDPTVADPSIVKNRSYLDLFHILCKNDIMQAALMLCIEIRSSNQLANSSLIYQEDFSFSKHSLTRVVENTLNGMLQRVGKFGSDIKDVVPLSIVLQSGRSDGTPEEKKVLMALGATRVLDVCRKLRPDIHESFKNGSSKDRKWCPKNEASNETGSNLPTPGTMLPPTPSADVPVINNYNFSPGSDFDLMNFDFSFADWDVGQSWL